MEDLDKLVPIIMQLNDKAFWAFVIWVLAKHVFGPTLIAIMLGLLGLGFFKLIMTKAKW